MRIPAYRNVVQSIVTSHCDKERRDQLLSRLREILGFPAQEHDNIVEEIEKNIVYILELSGELSEGEQIVIKLSDSREIVWKNGEETIEIEEKKKTDLLKLLKHLREKKKELIGHDRNGFATFTLQEINGDKKGLLSKLNHKRRRSKPEGTRIELHRFIPHLPISIPLPLENGSRSISAHLQVHEETEEECHISLNDALHLVRKVMDSPKETEEEKDTAHFLLHYPFLHYSLPPILLRLLSIAVYLKWTDCSNLREELSNLAKYQTSSIQLEENARHLVKRCLRHIRSCVEHRLTNEVDPIPFIDLFPPQGIDNIRNVNARLRDLMSLCIIPQWEEFNETDPSEIMRKILLDKLIRSVHEWADQFLVWECSIKEGKEKEVCIIFNHLTQTIIAHSHASNIFFQQFHINYIKETTEAIDEKITKFISLLLVSYTNEMSDRKSSDDVTKFSQVTMRLFEALHRLEELGMRNGKRDTWREKEILFKDCPLYWSTTWSALSREMLIRCRSLDDSTSSEGPLPSSLYSFLCIQKAISDDLSRLQLTVLHNQMLVTLRVVSIYCDNLTSYSNHLLQLASREAECCKSRECRTVRALNGMEQSMVFMRENWRRFSLIEGMEKCEEGRAIGETAEKMVENTMDKVTHSRDSLLAVLLDIRCREGLDRISQKMLMDRKEFKSTLAAYMRELSEEERLDEIAREVDRISSDCVEGLESSLVSSLLHLSFAHLSSKISSLLRFNHSEEYYRFIYEALQLSGEVLGITQCDSSLFRLLHYHSQPTKDLIRQFYAFLADQSTSNQDISTLNFIKMRTSASFVSDGLISLSLHVTSTSGLFHPLSPICSNSLFLRVSLLPLYLYDPPYSSELPVKSLFRKSTDLKRRHSFRMLISPEAFYTHGSVVAISLIEKDYLSIERVIGSHFILLSQIAVSHGFSDDLSQFRTIPFSVPPPLNSIPIFTTLKTRSSNDRLAKEFVRSETRKTLKKSIRSSHIFITQSLSTLSLP